MNSILTHTEGLVTKQQAFFILVATAFSWPIMFFIWSGFPADFEPGDIKALEKIFDSWLMLYGVGPMVSAVLVTAWFHGRAGIIGLFERVIRWRIRPHWFFIALLLPLVSQWLGLWLWGMFTGVEINYPAPTAYLFSWLQIAAISSLYFISEELGWRGFLLPTMLARFKWLQAALFVGAIWAVWHYPFWFTASWGASGNWPEVGIMVTASTVNALALSVMLTWIFKNANESVLLSMIFHGSNNASMGKILTAAGDAAHHGAVFLIIHAVTSISVASIIVLLTLRRKR